MKAFHQRTLIISLSLFITMFLTMTPARLAEPLAGQLDQTFGAGGVAITDGEGYAEVYKSVAVQPDGKIVAVGPRGGFLFGWVLTRYNPDGSLDSGFGPGGLLLGWFGSGGPANALAIQPDGKLIVGGAAGWLSSFPCAIARYHANGTPDTSFGDRGLVFNPFGYERYAPANAIALQSDGRIIVAGAMRWQTDYGYPGPFDVVVMRYTADGQLDQSFAGGQPIKEFFGNDDVAERVLVQPDDKILIAGTFTDEIQKVFVERLNADGTPDASFGSNGVILAPFKERKAQGVALARQADGKLLLASSVALSDRDSPTDAVALTRFNANGTPDTSFGNLGVVIESLGSNTRVGDLLVQPDGKVVVVANSNVSAQTSSLTLLRFNADGTRDSEFQSSAVVAEGAARTEAYAAVMQKDGKIVVAGRADANYMIARFESGFVVPDFALESATPAAGTVGEKVRITINVKRIGSFAGPVTIAAPDTGTPKIVVNQNEVATETSATFAFKIKRGAPKGDHTLVFRAKDVAGRERTVTVTLTVN